jgi:hypothetical protein
MIRGKSKPCPFGLPIPEACKCIGNAIFSLKRINSNSTNEDKESNYEVFLSLNEKSECPFADLIMEKKGAVDCKWNPEEYKKLSGNSFVSGSPIYPNIYIGNSKSYQSYPVNYYSDDNIRSIYYGIISLIN